MRTTPGRGFSAIIIILALLWLGQLGWLAWHFAPEALDLAQRLKLGSTTAVSPPADPFDRWLAELAHLLPADRTYIFVDCYETGNYAKMRYVLYPRRQLRLDPKATPALLFTMIQQEKVAFLILGGCNLDPHWHFLCKDQQTVFQTLPTAGPGLVLSVASNRIRGGFYD